MRRVLLLCFIGLVVLLAACQQNNLVSPVPTVTTLQATETPANIPTKTAEPTNIPQDELTPDDEHFIFVTGIQDRPNEMPELEPREDGFSQTDPWAIAPAFVPADGMRFLAIEVMAMNLSQSNWQVIGSKIVLNDSTGRGYPALLGRAFHSFAPFNLQYGQKSQGWVVFEIPADAIPKEIMAPSDEKHWILTNVDIQTDMPIPPYQPMSPDSASASNLTLSLLAIKDPGTPFSTFSYTYIKGYRPVNIMVEISNQSAEAFRFQPHHFVLMDKNGTLHTNVPGGASESFDGEDLQPDETRRGEVSFDLPEGVEPGLLIYMVTPYTDDYLFVSIKP